MEDKVQKIREEVEKLHGNPYYMMAVNDVLEILDMQEEPVSAKDKLRALSGGERDLGWLKDAKDVERYDGINDDLRSLVDKESVVLWKEINSGNRFSIVDSFNQFYGICMQVAESAVEWQNKREEPVSEELEEEVHNFSLYYHGDIVTDEDGIHLYDINESKLLEIARHFAGWGKKQAEIEIQAQSIAIAHGCYKEWSINNLEKAAEAYIADERNYHHLRSDTFKAGAMWQKEHLWKPADGDDLPEIDREVVAFQEIFPTDVDVTSLLKIVIAHRPNTNGWEGKSLASGKVEHYTPQTYDKGGWNIPNVKWWLDCLLPNMEEG